MSSPGGAEQSYTGAQGSQSSAQTTETGAAEEVVAPIHEGLEGSSMGSLPPDEAETTSKAKNGQLVSSAVDQYTTVTTRKDPQLPSEPGPSTSGDVRKDKPSISGNAPGSDGIVAPCSEPQDSQSRPRTLSDQGREQSSTRTDDHAGRHPSNAGASTRRRRVRGRGRVERTLIFFGYGRGNEERRALVRLIKNIVIDTILVAVILTLTIFSGLHHSPRKPSQTEWEACNKPLGVWACLWLPLVVSDLLLEIWVFRSRPKPGSERTSNPQSDAEQGVLPASTQPSTPPRTPSADPTAPTDQESTHHIGEGDYQETRQRMSALSNNRSYGRAIMCHALLGAAWFLSANIFVFSSVDTCRHDAPHLWWLVLSLVCLNYLFIIEVIALGFIFFIIWPLFFIAWNLYLLAMGRHPLINPHYFSPEIGKIPKKVVDKIPLVLYVPTPPWEDHPAPAKGDDDSAANAYMPKLYKPRDQPLKHSYPPKIMQGSSKRRFVFFRKKQPKGNLEVDVAGPPKPEATVANEKAPEEWEDLWDSEGYPFVRLDENRATCAICLLDFAEPRARVAREVIESWKNKKSTGTLANDENQEGDQGGSSTSLGPHNEGSLSRRNMPSDNKSVVSQLPAESSVPKSDVKEEPVMSDVPNVNAQPDNDVAEEPEPLRLLGCGHVFHQTCIDPWLTDVSGRCPTCQKPVLKQKKKRAPPPPEAEMEA